MASSQYYQNMYDVRLKPRLLKSIIRDRLPGEKHPFRAHSDLSYIVSLLETHGLLSESFPDETSDLRLAESWKSTVDEWVERLLSLVSSKMPDKCWAGVGLLGVTCKECSSDRFLASHSIWFQNLVSQIQPASDASFVKVASCASLSDLFRRLAHFPNAKKDGISQAGKLIQPVLKLLSEDGSEDVWEATVDLLCTLLTFFPSSVQRHYDSAESIIVSKIMSGKCLANISKVSGVGSLVSFITTSKFAQSLALLPKAKGNEDSWSFMMQRILISINTDLKDAFQGLEEDKKSDEIHRLLVPPGKDPPPPLGGQITNWIEQLLMSRVSTLLLCCCVMLTNHYPVQVTVPVLPLLALVRRILDVDGSPNLEQFTTVTQQEFICSELPRLHLCCLDLLLAIIERRDSQLSPYAAEVVRLLKEHFRRCAAPSVRAKIYLVVKTLLIRLGVGIARDLAPQLIGIAFVDLGFITHGSVFASQIAFQQKVGIETLQQPRLRSTPISVQMAALEALKALLTVSGALISEDLRSKADYCLLTVAADSIEGRWLDEERRTTSDVLTPNRAEFQLTALSALLASLLSSTRVRPPYLSQGLELFRKGRREAGAKVADFCAYALMAMTVLMHPRALPLFDSPSSNSSTVDEGISHSFLDSFLGNGDETRPLSTDELDKQINQTNKRFNNEILAEGPKASKFSDKMWAGGKGPAEEAREHAGIADIEMGGSTDSKVIVEESREDVNVVDVEMGRNNMVESMFSAVPVSRVHTEGLDSASTGGRVVVEESREHANIVDVEMGRNNMVESMFSAVPVSGVHTEGSESAAVASSEAILASGKTALGTGDETAQGKGVVTWMNTAEPQGSSLSISGAWNAGKGKEVMLHSDSESLDSLPDIIDGDPDED